MTRTAAVPPRPATAIPGPRGLPLLGSGRQLVHDPLGTYQHAMETYGDIVRLVVGPPGRRILLHALFAPDRFTPAREAARHRYAYLPFGAGPRACIGGSFALQETVLATAMIVRAYRLQTPPGPVPLAAGITLRPATTVPCSLQPLPTTPTRHAHR